MAHPEAFGRLPDGRPVSLWRLRAGDGIEAAVSDYGAIVQALRTPDRAGAMADVVLGFDALDEYRAHSPYFGAVVGRFANRIAGGRFTLDGRACQLAANDPPNHLHGGPSGFDRRLWYVDDATDARLRLHLHSPDGEEGYPGALDVWVDYVLTPDGCLSVAFEARTDAPTIVNLAQHSYFNLAGHDQGDVLAHTLAIDADAYTPVDDTMIPTGELAPVAGTPFDFREGKAIGRDIGARDVQLQRGGGFDHNFVLAQDPSAGVRRVASLADPKTGRRLDVLTDQPGLQFYSGNKLNGSIVGKGGTRYPKHAGLCLETQRFPDSPNRPQFPSARLDPGQVFRSQTIFRFSTGA